jgi:hypothetical protein
VKRGRKEGLVTHETSSESKRNSDHRFTSTSEVRDFCHLQRPPHPRSRLAGHRSPTSPVTMSKAAEAAIAASYKSLKEDFVSNLTGGEIGEINYVTAVAPVSFSFPSAGLF